MSTPRQRSSSTPSPSGKRNSKTTASSAVSPRTPGSLPAIDDRDGWRAHWRVQGQPWRTEPEIDPERQKELEQHRAVVPNIEKNSYPFKDMYMSRADVKWLLATHENGRGPIDWTDVGQRTRHGLDLRGAQLTKIDLSGLPLACMVGGLAFSGKWSLETAEQRNAAGIHLEEANLSGAHLEGANIRGVHGDRANFFKAYLEAGDLSRANLRETNLREAQLNRATLVRAHLEGADLRRSHVENADVRETHFEATDLREAHFEGANLRRAFFTSASNLDSIILDNGRNENVQLAGIHFGDTDLTMVRWSQMRRLGDEYQARQARKSDGTVKDRETRLAEYERAVQANRQLAVVLEAQGLNEQSARFAYRAQILQRVVLRQQKRFGQYLFSFFLDLLAGYGYKYGRSFLAYLLVISGFATAYYLLGRSVGPTLSPLGAFVFSMTSFHGRGFFPVSNISLDDPLTVLAALEALVGLIIEVTFIATLTQRFFNR